MIRIVIADDHEVVRAGFRMLLEQDPELVVVAEAADGAQAYEAVMRERPDILLMDISMPPGESGLIACEKIVKDFSKTRVIVLTMYADQEYLLHTLRGGASGYLLKTSTAEELFSAIYSVNEGGTYIHPKMAGNLTKQLFSGTGEGEDGASPVLTNRELEVLQLLVKGFTNKEISGQLYLSIKTVEAHRKKLYSKLNVNSRSDLVSYAIEHKLFDM